MNELKSFWIFARSASTFAATLGVTAGWQFVPLLCRHAEPAKPSANWGDPLNATPRSVDRLQCRALRGSRLPNPMPRYGANLLNETAAVPRSGSAGLLKYLVPPNETLVPFGTDAVAVTLLSL